jgi:hypothetical protein
MRIAFPLFAAVVILASHPTASANPPAKKADASQFIIVNRKPRLDWKHAQPQPGLREDFAEIKRAFPDVPHSKIRIGVGYIFSYLRIENDAVLLGSLRDHLQAATDSDTPLLIQLDGENWWDARPDLWNWWDPSLPGFDPANRANVEWSGWTPDHALKLAWRNWGSQLRVRPPPNLMSRRYRQVCHEKMGLLIPVIVNWWKALPDDKKQLLIGVKVGWESSIGVNAWYYPNGNDLVNQPASADPQTGLNGEILPGRGVATIGYAAAKTAGIREKGELTEADLAEVVKRHLDDLCGVASRLGVPREKLFTHIAGWKEGELLYQAGLNRWSCPGWSFYKHAADPTGDVGVQSALKRSDAPWWAATEWLYQGPREIEPWRAALEKTLADSRCRYVCIYNWEGIRESKPVLEAIRQTVEASGKPSTEHHRPKQP